MMESTLETNFPPNVGWENPETVAGHAEGCNYYEQYSIPGRVDKSLIIFGFQGSLNFKDSG